MSNPAPQISQSLHRPVVSPDGNFLAVIVPELEVHIISLTGVCPGNRVVKQIVLPRAARDFLSNVNILRWSPESMLFGESEDGILSTTSEIESGMTWLLLSDGDRVIVLSTELRNPQMIVSNADEHPSRTSNILADYQLGIQYGRITLVDFVFGHRHALVLFETNTHASILSLSRPQRDDIISTKYSDSRSFAPSPNNQYFALLLRSKGQDQIAVFSPKDDTPDNASTFSPRTSDAQGLQWSPNGDPVIVVWDSASYGVKVTFFTAMGHAIKQLDLSTLEPSRLQTVGIITLKWYLAGDSTILAVADGQKCVLIRRQDNKNMRLQPLASFIHPEIVNGSQYLLWQETSKGPREFAQQKIAFDNGQQDTGGEVDALAVNAGGSMICTRITTHPKVVWIWEPHSKQPSAVFIFRDNVKQLLWHPSLPHVLVITTAQKEPCLYAWYDISKPPALGGINIQASRPSKWDGEWLQKAADGRHPFMLSSSTAFDVVFLDGQDGQVNFESVLHKDFLAEEDEEESSEIITPSRSSRNVAIDAEPKPRMEKDDLIRSEAKYTNW